VTVGKAMVEKGDETAVIARIPMERMESAGIRVVRPVSGDRLFAGFFAGLEGFERTSENRGVPGSTPGLAISRKARIRASWAVLAACGPRRVWA
jgi:hypothetical protein